MKLKGRKIGVAITGSFCTYEKVFQALRALKKEEAELQTIFSDAAQSIDSRFGNAEDFVTKAKEITGAEPMLTIPQAEPIGPKGQHCEAGQWDYGHSCADGCKSASAQ